MSKETPNYDIRIKQGDEFTLEFTLFNVDPETEAKTARDITGYTAKMQVRQRYNSPDFLVEATTEDEANTIELGDDAGTVKVTMPPATTAALNFKEALYDIDLINAEGKPERILGGTAYLEKEVTR